MPVKHTLTIAFATIALGACGAAASDSRTTTSSNLDSPPVDTSEDAAPSQKRLANTSQKRLAERVSRHTISLAPSTVAIDGYLASFAMYADLPKGGGRLGWNAKDTLHISRVDTNYQKTGNDYTLPGYVVAQLLPLPDDTLLVAAVKKAPGMSLFNSFKSDLALDLIRLDAENKELFRTRVTGGHGTGPGNVWHSYSPTSGIALAHHSGQIGVFLQVSKNFGKSAASPDTHQGDLFAVLDMQGGIDESRTVLWSASHSTMPKLAATKAGGFVTVTSGDSYPFGIFAIHRDTKKQNILWPEKDQQTPAVKAKNRLTTGAGSLCGLTAVGNDLVATVGTSKVLPNIYNETKRQVLLLRFDETTQNVQRTWLSKPLGKGAGCPYSAALGNQLLVGWSMSSERSNPQQASLLLVDPSGTVVDQAIDIPYALGTHMSEFFNFANGDVGWTVVDYNADSVEVFRVAR